MEYIPESVIDLILNYAISINTNLTINSLKNDSAECLNLCLIFRRLDILKEHIYKICKIRFFLRKYYKFREYDTENGSCLLLDALSSGCTRMLRNVSSSVSMFSSDVENDIREIVELLPWSLNYKLDKIILYNKRDVTPLYMACLNENVSLNIVKLLLQSGVDVRSNILVYKRIPMKYAEREWYESNIWEELESTLCGGSEKNWDRYMKILKL